MKEINKYYLLTLALVTLVFGFQISLGLNDELPISFPGDLDLLLLLLLDYDKSKSSSLLLLIIFFDLDRTF